MERPKGSERLEKLKEENKRFELQSPYNFCDRWCERCAHEKQARCRLYQDEYERKLTCIAYGRDPDDSEVTAEILKQQYEPIEKLLEKDIEEYQIEIGDIDDSEFKEYERQDELAKNDSLTQTADQYLKKSHIFLEKTFINPQEIVPALKYDFETVAWYHTLLFVKITRALTGFHEAPNDDEFGLCDAVAQFSICKKATSESDSALRRISKVYTQYRAQIIELLALLSNIKSRIELLEQTI